MLKYQELKKTKRRFLALTGLTVNEFEKILPAFERAYERKYPKNKTVEGKERERKAGGGGESELKNNEDKLLLALIYQKSYPQQELIGVVFDLSQSRVNYWLHRLLPALKDTLDDLKLLPERDGKKFARHETGRGKKAPLIIDGVDRRRQRPKNKAKQKLHYSGKKKLIAIKIS
jgi:hypothetical protein